MRTTFLAAALVVSASSNCFAGCVEDYNNQATLYTATVRTQTRLPENYLTARDKQAFDKADQERPQHLALALRLLAIATACTDMEDQQASIAEAAKHVELQRRGIAAAKDLRALTIKVQREKGIKSYGD